MNIKVRVNMPYPSMVARFNKGGQPDSSDDVFITERLT